MAFSSAASSNTDLEDTDCLAILSVLIVQHPLTEVALCVTDPSLAL